VATLGKTDPIYSALQGILKTHKRVENFLKDQPEGIVGLDLLDRALRHIKEQPLLLSPGEVFEVAAKSNEALKKELLFAFSDMALCGLPYDETKEAHVERSVRLPKGVMRIVLSTADPNVSLPFGLFDRKVFMAITTLAVKQQSDTIRLGTTRDFIQEYLGRKSKGGNNADDVYASLERFSKLNILMEYLDDVRKLGGKTGIVDAYHLPNPNGNGRTKPVWKSHIDEFQLQLAQNFTKELLSSAFPVPKYYLQDFEDIPFAWDLSIFVPRRCSNAIKTSAIPLMQLKEQLGTQDSNKSRLKAKIQKYIPIIHKRWDEVVGRKNCCPAWFDDVNETLIVGAVLPGNELVPRTTPKLAMVDLLPPTMEGQILPGFQDYFEGKD